MLNVLRGCVFMLAIIVPYCLTYKGMTVEQFLWSETIFALTALLFEIPSGYLSDRWKRKNVLIVALFLASIGYLLFVYVPGFLGAALGNFAMGISLSLLSGTDTALIYDSLLFLGQENEARRHDGRRQGLSLGMGGIASIIGAFIYESHPHAPFLMGSTACLLGVFLCLFLTEPERQKRDSEHNPFMDILSTIHRCIKKPAMAYIILFGGIVFVTTKIGMWLQQPYYIELGIAERWFGFLVAGGMFIGWMGGEFSGWIEKRVSLKATMLVIWLFPCVAFFFAGNVFSYVAVFLLMSCSGSFGVGAPALRHEINNRADPARRATVLSTFSMLPHLFFIVLTPIIGAVNNSHGLGTSFLGLALFLLIMGLFFFVGLKRHKVI